MLGIGEDIAILMQSQARIFKKINASKLIKSHAVETRFYIRYLFGGFCVKKSFTTT